MKGKNEITEEMVMEVIKKNLPTITLWIKEKIDSRTSSVKNDPLDSAKAKQYLSKLRKAKMVDVNGLPNGLSWAEKGVLAFELARRLDIENVWSMFSKKWGMDKNALRNSYGRGMNQQKTADFIEKIKLILD